MRNQAAEAAVVNEPTTIEVQPDEAGQRLDRLLSNRLGVPRNQIQQWIRSGRVLIGGEPTKASNLAQTGDILECDPPSRDLTRGIVPEVGELRIVHEDPDLVILDKPAGLVVHPGAGRQDGTLVHRLLHRYPEIGSVGGSGRPGIVHRLDKDTTGLMVVARTQNAYESLSTAFAERRVKKTYLALVYGSPAERSGSIDSPIGRHAVRRKEMTVRSSGRPALTRYKSLGSANGISVLKLDLATGRTHQIRVHLKAIGHPLIGDPVYGEARWRGMAKVRHSLLKGFDRPALHAWRLEFEHPTTSETLTTQAPLPEDLRLLWEGVTDLPLPELL